MSEALDDTSLYFNRELSWLDFNDRVLQLAEDTSVPLFERAKFCAIWSSNLDEFFMVRVAGLYDQLEAGIDVRGHDGLTPLDQIEAIRERVLDQYERLSSCFEHHVGPTLAEHGVRVIAYEDASEEERAALDSRFHEQIFPVLTPLAVGLGRPFPYISNLSLSLAVLLRDPDNGNEIVARVKVPKELLSRFVDIGAEGHTLVPLEGLIAGHLDRVFLGMEILDFGYFRVARDGDFNVSDEADDLLQAVEDEVRQRRFGEVIRLEISAGMNRRLRSELIDALKLEDRQVYEVAGLLDLSDLWDVVGLSGFNELRDTPWSPVTQPRLQSDDELDLLAEMRRGDILLHHPYDSFTSSVERFVLQAVADPDVLAIKQTVYRTSDTSPLVPALIRASERGKQAVCLVELKARFDEQANIQWARKLEEAGVHVVYGVPSLKTHAKCVLVIRREGDGVRHYVHVGTGNYNPSTARLYTDLGLFTTDPEIGADVADLFNFLTGYGRKKEFRNVLIAPTTLRDGILNEITQTIEACGRGESAHIAIKANALVDAQCVRALYEASQAGVRVEVNVRGACSLRPGVPGVSENIRVISVVGRFLEHSRIYAFRRGEEQQVLIGSADLMPRNLDNRVELVVPSKDPAARADVLDVLERSLADEQNSWELNSEGEWERHARAGDNNSRSVHAELMERHATRAAAE